MHFLYTSAVAIGFFIAGVYLKKRVKRFKANGALVSAQIVDYTLKEADGAVHTMDLYLPTLQFENEQGEVITHKHDSGTTKRKELPADVTMFYLFEDGEYEVLINSFLWTRFFPSLFIGLGLLSAIGAVYSFLDLLETISIIQELLAFLGLV